MRHPLFRTIALFGAALVLASCSDSTGPLGTTVEGFVFAGDGTTPVADANVYLLATGPSSGNTKSDLAGKYRLSQVPSGPQTVVAQKGNFRAQVSINVVDGAANSAPPAPLVPQGKLGYVSGSYDNIQNVVTALGYPTEAILNSSLSTASVLNQYSMIFLNCGSSISTTHATALRTWVQNGGTLYASDYELTVIRAMFPGDVPTVGSGTSETVNATVVDQSIRNFLGKSTAEIRYNLGAWQMLAATSSVPRVLVSGSVTSGGAKVTQPMAISWNLGTGRVVYTTFHNSAAATADQVAVLRFFIHF